MGVHDDGAGAADHHGEVEVEPGETMHFNVWGLPYALSEVLGAAGALSDPTVEVAVTEEFISANTDRNGDSWLSLLHDEDGQIQRFGRVIMEAGPPPSDVVRSEPGSLAHERERAEAFHAARAVPDRRAREAAVRRAEERYGSPPGTSRTLSYQPGTGR